MGCGDEGRRKKMEDWRKRSVETRNAEKGTGLGVGMIMISV